VNSVVVQGAVLKDLKGACTCIQLKEDGYKLDDLKTVCSCKELKSAGFHARQLKDQGYTAGQLRQCGFIACELRGADFTAQEMKDGDFSDGELKGAGFSDHEIARASGLPDGMSASDIRKVGCGVEALQRLREAGVSASAIRRISGCRPGQMKAAGFSAKELEQSGLSAADLLSAGFTPESLKTAGYSARDLVNAGISPDALAAAGFSSDELKAADTELPPGITPGDVKASGCSVDSLKRERLSGVSASLIRQYAGCSAKVLKDAGFSENSLAHAGFSPEDIKAAGLTPKQLTAAPQVSDAMIQSAGCDPVLLKKLFSEGVSTQRILGLNGCGVSALKAAGAQIRDLADGGATPEQLLAAGFRPDQIKQAGLIPSGVIATGRVSDCSESSLKAAHTLGVSALTIKQTLGCRVQSLKDAGYLSPDLRAAGFTAAELKGAGFRAQDLKNAGFGAKELAAAGFTAQQLKDAGFRTGELKDAGFSVADLKNAGFTPGQLKAIGLGAKELKDAGISADELHTAGFPAKDMKQAGFSASQLKDAGYLAQDLKDAGFLPTETALAESQGGSPSIVPTSGATIPSLVRFSSPDKKQAAESASTKQLQEILKRQQTQVAEQRYQQKIQQKTQAMMTAATQSLQAWKNIGIQAYTEGVPPTDKKELKKEAFMDDGRGGSDSSLAGASGNTRRAVIKMGDILFAVIDTSVNSDEPGPILATIVSGRLKGAKLSGSFTLPSHASKMVITFHSMSVSGASKTTSVNAYAIDQNTARTALSSRANHHYLSRYGTIFASTFLEGFGNAFQSADTTITIGGTGGVSNTTIQNGVGRSLLDNAVIGLATLGKSWGQIAMQNVNRPTTVELYSGTGIGVLFTQDVASI
jgi:intracellular multiplication protein IcmE